MVERLFAPSLPKILVFVLLLVLFTILPRGGLCADGIDFGYCIGLYGLPFPSFLISGELANIPPDIKTSYVASGIFGTVGNAAIAYILACAIIRIFQNVRSPAR